MTSSSSASVSTHRYACVGPTAVRLTSRRSRRSRPSRPDAATPACRRRRSRPRRRGRRRTRTPAGCGRPTGRSRTSGRHPERSRLSGTVASGMSTAPGTWPFVVLVRLADVDQPRPGRQPLGELVDVDLADRHVATLSTRQRSSPQVARCVDVAQRRRIDGHLDDVEMLEGDVAAPARRWRRSP